jgi:NADH-quinone oxidoreductase subunit L
MGGEQDMRKMGGLWGRLPATSRTFLVATLALTGCPFFAGFFSKDEILWQAWSSPHGHPLLWLVATAVAGLTAFYMFRQVFMVFFGECRADHETQHHLHESPRVMTLPLWLLAAGSVLAGYLGIPKGLGDLVGIPHFFEGWLAPVLGTHGPLEAAGHAAGSHTAMELGLMAVSIAVAATGFGVAYLMYYRGALRPERFAAALGGLPYRAVLNKYWVDELYQLVFVRGGLALFRLVAWIDLHVIDGVVNLAAAVVRGVARVTGVWDAYVVDGAVNGVAVVTQFVGRRVRNLQTGAITAYLYVVVIGVLGGVLLYWSWARAS